MDWIALSIVIVCLVVSGFFAASETALTGASRASRLRLSKHGNSEAGVVSSLMGMRERLIGALLLGNNIANIGASALATGIFTAWFGEVGVAWMKWRLNGDQEAAKYFEGADFLLCKNPIWEVATKNMK